MKRSFFLFGIIYLLTAGISLYAQNQNRRPGNSEETATETRRQNLDITIEARVLHDEIIAWSETDRQITAQGSPARVVLNGSNIIVVVDFTPYTSSSSNVLVAQGQIWIAESEGELTYYVSIEAIPFELGEPILYLPLGQEQLNPSIELIVSINTYIEGRNSSGNNPRTNR